MSKQMGINAFDCSCDSMRTKSIILNKNFNSIPRFDTIYYSQSQFNNLPDTFKTQLWYREFENISPIQFTQYWGFGFRKLYKYSPNDSAQEIKKPANHYHLFLNNYFNRTDIELVFVLFLGPWDIRYYIVKRIDCCFLITQSYYSEPGFTFKSYSIIDKQKLDSLYNVIRIINKQNLSEKEGSGGTGYFADNRNKKKFFIDFDKEKEKGDFINYYQKRNTKKMQDFYNFLYKKINWTPTYKL